MATPFDIGLDIKAIVEPFVDLGMGLAGTARVTAELTMIGTRTVDPTTDLVTETGGYKITIPAILYQRSEQDGGELAAVRESTLLLNASDLVAAGVPDTARPRSNDKVLINGDTWTVFGIVPVPTNVIYMLRIRR